jgi:hypothetical protein
MKHRVRVAVMILAVTALWILSVPIARAFPGPGSWHIKLWMLPPVDALGNFACLTNSWHDPSFDPYRALDWKATCHSIGTETVRFRAVAASIDESYDGTFWAALNGVPSNIATAACPGGPVHRAKVKIYGGDGHLNGYMIYAHSVAYGGQFTIQAQAGATLSSAYLTSVGIADTVSDGPGDCWDNWHVHEVNSSDAVMLWNGWNGQYTGIAPPDCNCYVNDNHSNWTRRMTAVVNLGE